MDWQSFFNEYRGSHPTVPYRVAQKRASCAYRCACGNVQKIKATKTTYRGCGCKVSVSAKPAKVQVGDILQGTCAKGKTHVFRVKSVAHGKAVLTNTSTKTDVQMPVATMHAEGMPLTVRGHATNTVWQERQQEKNPKVPTRRRR